MLGKIYITCGFWANVREIGCPLKIRVNTSPATVLSRIIQKQKKKKTEDFILFLQLIRLERNKTFRVCFLTSYILYIYMYILLNFSTAFPLFCCRQRGFLFWLCCVTREFSLNIEKLLTSAFCDVILLRAYLHTMGPLLFFFLYSFLYSFSLIFFLSRHFRLTILTVSISRPQ